MLMLGATGSSGSMAVQIAHFMGAGQIVAAGRDRRRLATLAALGATHTVTLDDPALGALASDVDVALDYIWGEESVGLMEMLLRQRTNRSQALTWVQIGSAKATPLSGVEQAWAVSAHTSARTLFTP